MSTLSQCIFNLVKMHLLPYLTLWDFCHQPHVMQTKAHFQSKAHISYIKFKHRKLLKNIQDFTVWYPLERNQGNFTRLKKCTFVRLTFRCLASTLCNLKNLSRWWKSCQAVRRSSCRTYGSDWGGPGHVPGTCGPVQGAGCSEPPRGRWGGGGRLPRTGTRIQKEDKWH